MIPSPNTAIRVSPPPEKRLRKPSTPDDLEAASSCCDLGEVDERDRYVGPELVQGDDGQREEDLLAKVGNAKMLSRLASMGLLDAAVGRCYRLVRALP